MTTTVRRPYTVRSIATCTACRANYLFVGTVRDRNGQLCACDFATHNSKEGDL